MRQVNEGRPLLTSEVLANQQKLKAQSLTVTSRVSEEESEEFYIFYSFDLTNSTQFKIRHPKFWPDIIKLFFYEAERFMDYECLNAGILGAVKVWRLVGDEVLFYQRITKLQDCFYSVPLARRVLDQLIDILQTDDEFRDLLSVKSTVWCARTKSSERASEGNGVEGSSRNIKYTYKDIDAHQDFLGPDIDTGFRLANLSTRNRVVVSADLAYLYENYKGRTGLVRQIFKLGHLPCNLMKIVCLEKLKGVWNGRSYPVIWYEKDWENLSTTFYYDDEVESSFLQKIKNNAENYKPLKQLLEIYDERGCAKSMEEFLKAVGDINVVEYETTGLRIPKTRQLELHCVPVCVNQDGQILIAKRPSNKPFKPNCWEFGCGQLDKNQTIEECLISTCRNDFGIDVVIDDEHRPIALKDYWFSDSSTGRKVPGVTFAIYCPNVNAASNKHTEVKWLDFKDVRQAIGEDDVVGDFWETIGLAEKRIQCDWGLQTS